MIFWFNFDFFQRFSSSFIVTCSIWIQYRLAKDNTMNSVNTFASAIKASFKTVLIDAIQLTSDRRWWYKYFFFNFSHVRKYLFFPMNLHLWYRILIEHWWVLKQIWLVSMNHLVTKYSMMTYSGSPSLFILSRS